MTWVPVQACTLPTVEQPVRVAELQALLVTSMLVVRRLAPDRLELTLTCGGEIAAPVRDLTNRESACCSFFTFTIEERHSTLAVEVTVPAERTGVLDALAAQAEAVLTSRG